MEIIRCEGLSKIYQAGENKGNPAQRKNSKKVRKEV